MTDATPHRVRPRLLDLFCGAGGAAMGYHRAGFDVVGVDIADQPNYPFRFIRGDAITTVDRLLEATSFDAIHASPPCQAYTHARHLGNRGRMDHPQLVAATRGLLKSTELPFVIENVEGAPLENPILLCGSMFGLEVRRHRLFESNVPMLVQPCVHAYEGEPRFPSTPRADGSRPMSAIVNPMSRDVSHEMLADGMGIDWMPKTGFRPTNELREAIPPAYTEFVGGWLLEHLEAVAA
jgi:DNA (cytosine-5)-methyltransferase 1